MNKTGIIEGFFGPQWTHEARISYAPFLKEHGGGFYLYAPKQDPNLRKNWRSIWTPEYLKFLQDLAGTFHKEGILFGVGFSPFGLGTHLSAKDITLLEEKLSALIDIGIDMLGIFFDDMPTNNHLAETQIEALNVIRKNFKNKIIFCPSYYTPDPILDKVFGPRPLDYLEKIANGISPEVSIAWTGPKVISMEIPYNHLAETTILLKRKPFLWENLYANDGPKNCKFLKLKSFTGRSPEAFNEVEAFGFNMMNQPYLSQIVYLSSLYVLNGEFQPDEAFKHSLKRLCSDSFSDFILTHRETFLTEGLDQLTSDRKQKLTSELNKLPDPAAREIEDWLEGKYIVGSECLTD